MLTLKERIIALTEVIVGKEQLDQMLKDESAVFLKGGFYTFYNNDLVKNISFNFNSRSLSDIHHITTVSFFKCFNEALSNIQNEENQYLQVLINWKYKSHAASDWIKDHNTMVESNENILMSIFKMFDPEYQFTLRSDFEEFKGVVTKFYRFGFQPRQGRMTFEFTSTSFDLSTDVAFWNSVSDFIGSRYAVYVPSRLLQTDYENIINNLPEQIAWSVFEERYNDKQRYNNKRYGK